MGKEQGSEFYDTNLHRCKNPAKNLWVTLYKLAYTLLPSDPGTVVDIGCGTGGMAKILYDRRHMDYWGIDFSPKRIEIARKTVPDFKFTVADIFDLTDQLKQYSCFIMLEVLEHIECDLELVASLPQNSTVIFSVPSFDDESHVRHFDSVDKITLRYAHLLDFKTTIAQQVPKRRKVWWISKCRKG